MTEAEKKALALLNEFSDYEVPDLDEAQYSTAIQALCRAIEQHEAYKLEVSDRIEACRAAWPGSWAQFSDTLERFIIPKADPLVEAWDEAWGELSDKAAKLETFRAALAARGHEVRKIGEGE